MKTAIRISLGAWLIYLSVLAPSLASMDGNGMLNVAVSIVAKHNLTVEPDLGEPGADGKFYSKWYPLLSFLAVPFVAAGFLVARYTHLPATYLAAVFAMVLSTIIAALTVGTTYYLARSRLGASEQRSIAAALAFGFGTLALRHSRSFYADPLLALLVTLAVITLLSEKPNAWVLALLSSLAILAKPTGILVGLAALIVLLRCREYRAALLSTAGSLGGAALYAAYNWVRFGNILSSGQPNLWSLRHAPEAFAGLLFSPSVGLLVCCPVLILALRKPTDRNTRLILYLGGAYLLLYSFWQSWPASSWGPRLLMPIMPMLMALSVITKHRYIWLALALFGTVLQLPSLVGFPERYDAVLSQKGITESDTAWSLRLAPTTALWSSSFEQVRDALQHPDVGDFSLYRPRATTLAESRNYRILPFWWWMLPLLHVPRVFGFLVAVAEVLSGIWIIANRSISDSGF